MSYIWFIFTYNVELSEVLWTMILSPLNFEAESFDIISNSMYLFFSFLVWAGKAD